MLLWGASAYLSTLVPRNLAQDVGRRLLSFRVVATVVAVATTVVLLPLETAFIGDGWGDALHLTTIRDVLFETSVGQAWQVQAVAALILAATLAISPGRRQAATALASGFLLASIALSGHAVMQEGWVGAAHRINDAIHVLFAGAWLGALVPLLPILKTLNDPDRHFEATTALMRFSTTGHVAVALVIASGVINTILILGRWPSDWSSPYQAMLASKIILVGIMVAVATVNRYAFLTSGAVRALRLGTVTEIALGLCVVGLVSVFGMLEPM
jgi:putative copper resistance protein D